jgi:dienelactone hydrolase
VTQIVIYHSVLGVRKGIQDAAEIFRHAGHEVTVVDQYEGRTFDDYTEASAFAENIGYPTLMEKAISAVETLADGFIAAGFSNGGGMAEYVATRRKTSGVLMFSGALPLTMIGISEWPHGVPAQIHYTVDDPFRLQEGVDAVAASVRAAGASVELFDYPGQGHLFTDKSLPKEYDANSAEILWQRALGFCASPLTD